MRNLLLTIGLLASLPPFAGAQTGTIPEADGSELQLEFQREVKGWKDGENPPAEPESGRLSARLGRDYFYLEEGPELRVHDLRQARFVRIAGGERREDFPLLALVAEREHELNREIAQYSLLARSGTAAADMDARLFFAEARAGIRSPVTTFPARAVGAGPGEKAWTVDGGFVTSWKTGGFKVPSRFRESYACLLAHQFALHPEFRRQIADLPAIPSEIRFRERVGARWRETRLHRPVVAEREDTRLPAGDKPLPLAVTDHPLSRAAAIATGRLDEGLRPISPAEFERQQRDLLERGLHVEALLSVLEFYLQSGIDTEPAIARLEALAQKGDDLDKLLDGLAIATRAEAVASLGSLAKLERAKMLRRHVYDVTAANAMFTLGKLREAEPLYLSALAQNPWLTGVYKKLGDLYAASERFPLAWTCYETALLLNAKHPMLKEFLAEAPRLRQEHPDFFIPKSRGWRN